MSSWLQSLTEADKERFMLEAVELAGRGRGRTAPNPCVGALLLREGEVVARGWHKRFGSAHAEVEAISEARAKGVDVSECSLWVTLEPCHHFGKTPPCTQAILEAGIRHVYIGTRDPNKGVAGGGAEFLSGNGVNVETDIAPQACRDLIADFVLWQTERRPFVLLKLACTLDGKIGNRHGRPLSISGRTARQVVQQMRLRVGAVLVGGNTFHQDNPRLNCRLSGKNDEPQPLAVVMTSRLPEPDGQSYLITQRPGEVIFWTDETTSQSSRARDLAGLGVRVWPLGAHPDGLDIKAGLQRLFAEEACHYLLLEGGGRLASCFAEAGLVDEFNLFLSPKVLGDDAAVNSFSGREVLSLEQALLWRLVKSRNAGEDLWLIYRPAFRGLDSG